MLIGQAKIDFEEWYMECYEKENLPYIQGFYIASFSCQYGVIVDWFDSVGIYIQIYKANSMYFYSIDYNSNFDIFKTRPQARQKAIEKANEIYNNR